MKLGDEKRALQNKLHEMQRHFGDAFRKMRLRLQKLGKIRGELVELESKSDMDLDVAGLLQHFADRYTLRDETGEGRSLANLSGSFEENVVALKKIMKVFGEYVFEVWELFIKLWDFYLDDKDEWKKVSNEKDSKMKVEGLLTKVKEDCEKEMESLKARHTEQLNLRDFNSTLELKALQREKELLEKNMVTVEQSKKDAADACDLEKNLLFEQIESLKADKVKCAEEKLKFRKTSGGLLAQLNAALQKGREVATLRIQMIGARSEADTSRAALTGMNDRLTAAQAALGKEQQEHQAIKRSLDECRAHKRTEPTATEEADDLRQQLREANAATETETQKRLTLEGDKNGLIIQTDNMRREINEANANREELTRQVGTLTAEIGRLHGKLGESRAELDTANTTLSTEREKFHLAKEKLEIEVKEKCKDYDGKVAELTQKQNDLRKANDDGKVAEQGLNLWRRLVLGHLPRKDEGWYLHLLRFNLAPIFAGFDVFKD